MFKNTYNGKKVLVTGNTGFKGSWLTTWLLKMGAEVYGISNEIPTTPSMFEALGLESKIQHNYADITDLPTMQTLFEKIKPDFVFHLAAQPIVSRSYKNPVESFNSNVMGTAHILEALRVLNRKCTVVMISSDKCYENVEWNWGYRENDHLGGKDPYSASKGACEIVIHSYYHSFFKREDSNVRLVSVRAGNVIGGGDWGVNRLVPDCIRAWSNGEIVVIRNPYATRPWQHVLEPLGGYLRAGQVLNQHIKLNGEPYNFGPPANQINNVLEMIEQLRVHWGFEEGKKVYHYDPNQAKNFHEAGLLKLNCDKALAELGWLPILDFVQTAQLTSEWYQAFYNKETNMFDLTNQQITQFISAAKTKDAIWIN